MAGKKDKPQYSMAQNIAYILKNLWRWERWVLLVSAARIPAMVALPLLMVWMPRVVLDGLTRHVQPGEFVLSAGLAAAAIVVCSVWNRWLEGRLTLATSPSRMQYTFLIVQKSLTCDYEWTQSAEGRKSMEKAGAAVQHNNRGAEQIVPRLVVLTAGALGFVLYGSLLGALHPLLVVFLIGTAALAFLAGRQAQRFEHHHKDELALLNGKLWNLLTETTTTEAGKDIRLFGLSAWFNGLFHSLLGDGIAWAARIKRRNYFSDTVEALLVALRDGVAYAYLLTLTLQGRLELADFVLYFGLVAGFSTWLTDMTTQLTDLHRMSLEICDIRAYLEKTDEHAGIDMPPANPGALEFRHVRYQYPDADAPALRDFHLMIQPGERIALVGVNGAGKSTAVKLLCGLYRPTEGQILCDGRDISTFEREAWFTRFSAVFQDIFELPVSIARNIAPDVAHPVDRDRTERCLKLSGLWDKVSALPNGMDTPLVRAVNDDATKFSGGEMQRLMLARALYKDAPILVLDEPTAALDPIAESELYERYHELTAGRTAIFISHRLASTRFCDRVVFLEGGVVAECGSHEELMARNGGYAEMFRVQSHYYQQHPERVEVDEAV